MAFKHLLLTTQVPLRRIALSLVPNKIQDRALATTKWWRRRIQLAKVFSDAAAYSELQSNTQSSGGTVAVNAANAFVAQKGVAAAERVMSGSGSSPSQVAEVKDFLKEYAGQLAGVTAPQRGGSGGVQPAGGEEGAKLRSDARAATSSGAPPQLSAPQADAVQGNYSDAQSAVGKGPSSTPAAITGPDGGKVTASGVHEASTSGQQADTKAVDAGGDRVRSNVRAQAIADSKAIQKAGEPGAQVSNVVAAGSRVVTEGVGAGMAGVANVGLQAVGSNGRVHSDGKGSRASRSSVVQAPPPDFKTDIRDQRADK